MAADLSGGAATGLHTQLCGDAHLSNFGVFAAPDRRLVFSINDFDETLPGPVRVGREAAGRELRRGGPRPGLRRQGAGKDQPRSSEAATARRCTQFAGMRNMDIWYDRINIDEILAQFTAQATAEQKKRLEQERRQGPDEGQPLGLQQADGDSRRRAANRRQSAADRPDGRACRRRRGDADPRLVRSR